MARLMDRRALVGTSALLGVAGALGVSRASASAEEVGAEAGYEVSEEMQADVVVIGGGNSGMPATVEAAELGAKVILLEKAPSLGGNGLMTFGPAGWHDEVSLAAGIDFDYHEAIAEELNLFNYRQNALFFIDMAESSPADIHWCIEHGVHFAPTVDNYKGGHPTMHYFVANEGDDVYGEGGRQAQGYAYIATMEERALEAGATILTETPAIDIVMDGEKVVGVIAQRADGSFVKVFAKAVIIATGGWQASEEMRLKYGRGDDLTSFYCGMPYQTGDGQRLAIKAGALDTGYAAGFVDQPYLSELFGSPNVPADNIPFLNDNHPLWRNVKCGVGMWINEKGERFTDEACGHPETGLATWAAESIISQKQCYVLIDAKMSEDLGAENLDMIMRTNDQNTKFSADTIEGLAEAMGMEAAVLAESIEKYNGFCADGLDVDFQKRADALIPLEEGPYYAFRLCAFTMCSVGGIRINRQMQACDALWNEIPGLYAIGVDSMPMYPSMYYFNMPGSGIAFEIHSGLVAARHAVKTCL